MDLRALLANRWALAGLGVAGAAGGYVWWRRRNGGGPRPAGGGSMAQDTPAYSGGPGTFDSTGTDVAHWLGDYSANLQNQLDDYQKQLSDALEALKHVPTAGTPSPTPAPLPRSKSKDAPSKKWIITQHRWTRKNPAWDSYLGGIAARYHITEARLMQLNPTIKNPNVIHVGQKIRVA